MKHFFSQDTPLVGIIAGLGSELGLALVLTLVLLAIGAPITEHLRWYAAVFITPILLLRQYAKSQNHPKVVKTLITLLFLTFLLFMFLLTKVHGLQQ